MVIPKSEAKSSQRPPVGLLIHVRGWDMDQPKKYFSNMVYEILGSSLRTDICLSSYFQS